MDIPFGSLEVEHDGALSVMPVESDGDGAGHRLRCPRRDAEIEIVGDVRDGPGPGLRQLQGRSRDRIAGRGPAAGQARSERETEGRPQRRQSRYDHEPLLSEDGLKNTGADGGPGAAHAIGPVLGDAPAGAPLIGCLAEA